MRYISALHIGRVNPQRLDFAVNVADEDYDLPEFLRDDVIHASDVSAVLEQVEPPYPGFGGRSLLLKSIEKLASQDSSEPLPAIKKPLGRRFLSRRAASGALAPSLRRFAGERRSSVT